MKPALVTGATGFLGRALVRRLAAGGRPVIALTRASSDAAGLAGATIAVHDGTTAGLRAILAEHRPETVFHLAAHVRGDERRAEELEPLVRANVLLGTQLAEACAQTRAWKFVNAGTYFERRDGTDAYDPVSLYAATKRAFRDVLDYYARATPLRAASLCLFDLYGPGDPRSKLLNLLAEHAASGKPLALSPGEQRLDLVHVDDAAAAFLRAEALLGEAPPELRLREWCVSSGERLTVRALVTLFGEATGQTPPVQFGGRPYREREVMNPWNGPPLPGWKPEIPLKEGLCRVYGAAASRP